MQFQLSPVMTCVTPKLVGGNAGEMQPQLSAVMTCVMPMLVGGRTGEMQPQLRSGMITGENQKLVRRMAGVKWQPKSYGAMTCVMP